MVSKTITVLEDLVGLETAVPAFEIFGERCLNFRVHSVSAGLRIAGDTLSLPGGAGEVEFDTLRDPSMDNSLSVCLTDTDIDGYNFFVDEDGAIDVAANPLGSPEIVFAFLEVETPIRTLCDGDSGVVALVAPTVAGGSDPDLVLVSNELCEALGE